VARVKEIGTQPALQKQILKRAIDFWRAEPGHPLGWVDPTVWQRTARLLYTFKQIPRQVAPSSYYTERFIPASGKG
jgi:hypothetical protein